MRTMMKIASFAVSVSVGLALAAATACKSSSSSRQPAGTVEESKAATAVQAPLVDAGPPTQWELDTPVQPLPTAALGVQADFKKLKFQVTPEKARLGKWLYFDTRLSADNT